MPFQSEKQRRYLWANEPEIARDWTDTYGSGIAKALGGRIGYQDGTLTKKQIAMIRDMLAKGMDTSTIETITGATADQIKNLPSDDQSKGTIEFDPNNVQINKAGMLPDNFIEQIKSLWGGEPPTPEGIMKAGGYPFMDPVDGNYIPRETRATNWSELDDLEAQEADAQRQMERARLANMKQYPTETEDEGSNWLMSALNYLPFFGKNTRTGAFMRMLRNQFMPDGGITSMFNRPTTPQQQATQRFMQNYNVGRNPQTGRMTSGPFAGRNLPGTSMFGSTTPQEMAQNWMKKYGSMNYQTERQMAKQKEIRDIAAGNTNIPPSERIVKPTITPKHGPHQYQGGNGNQSGSTSGRSDAGHAAAGGSGMHGGRHYDRGGLAALWPR